MPRATANGIELEYETFGDRKAAPLLLISGLGSQMIGWDDDFCRLLAGRGFHVIRFDNRDAGLSTWMEREYRLDDMAADAVGLLDALGIPAMSGPNGDDQVRPTDEGTAVLMAPAPDTREERIAVGLWAKQKLLGSADPFNEQYEALRITRAIDRAYHPAGFVRQLQAIMAANGRLARLAHVRVPTLVIHGADDILVPVENGRNVAAAIPGARYVEIEGMGHDVPRRVWAQVADAIAELAGSASHAC
ncbi:MAG: hypothetical protein AUH27_03160 [Chloroflexi bacterium 13_1_40CM_66_19]|nr:MAG: hypothetical protein AUH27_03160 [Chloroflexi bacterium 13_1_40CM_66_19]